MALNGAPRRDRDEGDAFDGGAGHSGAVTPAKRARGGARHHPREYIPGAVMKVKLHNFMTYSDVEMEPGPRLNVILGPNGTGKSSFVCALAIGLAGSTKLLGRADKISEFVKRGEQSGYSEITLATKNPNRPLVVRRDIKRKDGTSTWKVNGVTVPLERVKTEMRAARRPAGQPVSVFAPGSRRGVCEAHPREAAAGDGEGHRQRHLQPARRTHRGEI